MPKEDAGLYERFFSVSPDMLCIAGFDGYFKELNGSWEKSLGAERAELLGAPYLDRIHPEDRPVMRAEIDRLSGGAEQVSFESRCLSRGSYIWLSWHCAAMPGENSFCGVVRDITERKRTETALRDSEATVSRILDQAPLSMAIVAMDGTIEFINQKLIETFGYRPEDIPTMDRMMIRVFPNENSRREAADAWESRIRKALAGKRDIEGKKYRVTCKDGSLKTVFIFGVITAGKIIVMIDDITQRMQTEAALRDSEARYRTLVETTATGYVIIDGNGKVVDANLEYLRLTGRRDLKEILGRSVLEWTAEHEKEKNAKAVRQCAADGYIRNFEVDYADSAGRLTPVEVNASVVRIDGEPRILTLCRDITERRLAETEIRELNTGLERRVAQRTMELAAANQELMAEIAQRRQAETEKESLREQLLQAQKMEAVGRLADGIVHDFNNILVSISGHTEFLIKTLQAGTPAQDDLAEILLEIDRGAALTRQLVALSRKQPMQLKVIDLNRLTADTEKMLKRLIGANMRLETRLLPDTGRVKADPGQVSQIVMNLVLNARDAMPEGGRIVIETGNEEITQKDPALLLDPGMGSYVTLSVRDTGSGMDQETVAHMFEPFFTTKEPGKGTGLGLPTVYGIISRLGGGIALKTAPGKGTDFKVYFPRTTDGDNTPDAGA